MQLALRRLRSAGGRRGGSPLGVRLGSVPGIFLEIKRYAALTWLYPEYQLIMKLCCSVEVGSGQRQEVQILRSSYPDVKGEGLAGHEGSSGVGVSSLSAGCDSLQASGESPGRPSRARCLR